MLAPRRRRARKGCIGSGKEESGSVATVEHLAPSETPSTLRNHIARVLRQQILEGRFKPGDRLNESQIAREFSTSRIPVREALSHLQEQGLVMNLERRGMFVIQLSEVEVQQINSLRIVLEAEAMKLARVHMTAEVRAQLEALVEQMEHWEGPLAEAADLDRRFHQLIWRTAGNPWLERMLDQLTIALFAHKTLEHVSREMRQWRLNHHRELLDVVTGGNVDPRMALLTHLRMAYSEPERFSSMALAID
nr:GntR family transcriptional regulator [Novosphingobium piscinae]